MFFPVANKYKSYKLKFKNILNEENIFKFLC